ncbi:MAG: hypothetical protein COU63_00735 [Candidatus Pacebacteria bacterium CG10_big_fil_rev_8_21_14_0_10_36_11]|nr:hypothetical protein [Candidatus Pacearchaeota archaeon]OIP74548.1 MAG: hypothetical protein AUK08_00335 [Candidatus Pacebacteria bacterium CG2_30_36_39]PIR65173.1 MAG: hypothetical protein COU63_00735 [Candidatus Pacebacteria bacterium CG10_big_fil_rev_8_21_14_0_10_36_11]PJC43157.1 MAG: hypothetical protein CO040_00675 [Candidatus Pacebacteria bacterium CG_4_9_14_0_2_um_filter_36_8]
MKITFVASIKDKEQQKFYYLSIVRILKDLGHQVLYEHILKEDIDSLQRSIDKNIDFHKKYFQKINEADLIVAEITFENISVGYLIHEALQLKKPIIAVSRIDVCSSIPVFLENNQNFIYLPYKKIFELEKNLPKAVKMAPIEKIKKFNVLISESLDLKLQKLAQEKGLSKSEFVRSLIREM